MKRLALLAIPLTLVGCATQERVRTVRVEVPVPVECPRPVLPARPVMPLADLPDDASDADIARAAVASLHACTGYARQLERLIVDE